MIGSRVGHVYVRERYAGIIKETDEGYEFNYDDEYFSDESTVPVSLTLPKSHKSHKSKILFPFFDGLIPEGWLLNIVSNNWKIDQKDRFGLLLVSCRDCIGCVSIREEKE